ncbi:MAG: Na+/H+ antiporter subunit E [Actinomycetota bacterium]
MDRIRRRLPSAGLVAWLTVVWVLLWGDVSPANVVNGVILGLFVSILLPLPRVTGLGAFRPLAVAVLVGRFVVDAVRGALEVAAIAFRAAPPRSAVVKVPLRSHSDVILASTAGLTSLIPGSVVVEAHRLTGVLYLHVFDVAGENLEADVERVRHTVLAQEERLMRALSSDAELADAGYLPGWRVGSGELDATSGEVRP